MKVIAGIVFFLWLFPGQELYAQSGDATAAPAAQLEDLHKAQAPWFVSRFKLSAGLFVAVNNTDVRVENATGTKGTNIDFENDLGFNRGIGTFLADAQWRASRRSRFDLSYYGIHRTAFYTLKKDIDFGDHTYAVDSRVNAFFNTDIYRFSYGYALLSKPRYEAGLLIGAHVIGAGVGIGISGANVNSYSDAFSFTAPLPDVGVWGGYAINSRWAVNGEFSYLSLTVDNTKGRILSGYLNVTYRLPLLFEVSLGYTGFNFDVNTVRKNLSGDFKWSYNGPSLTGSYSFGKKKWRMPAY